MLIKYEDVNNNSYFTFCLLYRIDSFYEKVFWVVKNINISQKMMGDMNTKSKIEYIAYEFDKKVARDHIVKIRLIDLFDILMNSRTVYDGTFTCFGVDSSNQESSEILTEVIIEDGYYFEISSHDNSLLSNLKNTFRYCHNIEIE